MFIDANPFHASGNPANQRRIALRDPAKDKKRRAHAEFVEQREQPVSVGLDTALHAIPVVPGNDAFEGADVVVVLDVDAHAVDDRRRRAGHGYAPRRRRTVFTVSKMM